LGFDPSTVTCSIWTAWAKPCEAPEAASNAMAETSIASARALRRRRDITCPPAPVACVSVAGGQAPDERRGWLAKRYIRNYVISQASTGNSGCYFTAISQLARSARHRPRNITLTLDDSADILFEMSSN
jgi:hypothetical protein